MKPWKVISFYTDDPLYRGEMRKLRKSLDTFDIDHVIEMVPRLESWRATTVSMSSHILSAFNKYKENLVYLDSDAIIRQYPALFDTIEEDFACHYKSGTELLAGTMYFKNCEKVKCFINEWISFANLRTDPLAAQTSIVDALYKTGISVYRLPAPYTLIFDSMADEGPPVIEHFQASRRAKCSGLYAG